MFPLTSQPQKTARSKLVGRVVPQQAVAAALLHLRCFAKTKKEQLQQQLLPLAQANTQNVSIDNFY
jgi:hypothetical protein